MKKAIQKVAVLAVGLVFGVAVLEAGLQAWSLGRAYQKNARYNGSPGTGRVYTILCLGESTTDGQYPWQLEEILNSRNTGRKFRVIDRGKAGMSTKFILASLEHYLDADGPDMVVAMMGINDNRDDLAVFEYKQGPWYTRMKSYRLARILWFRLASAPGKRQDRSPAGTGSVTGPENEYARRGEAFLSERRFAEAEAMFRKAAWSDPADVKAYLGLGSVCVLEAKYDEAEKAYLRAIRMSRRDERPYGDLGKLYLNFYMRRSKEAREMYRNVLRINPGSEEALLGIGDAYHKEGKNREAEAIYRSILEKNPREGRAYAGIGLIYLSDEKKMKEGEAMLLKSLELGSGKELEACGGLWFAYIRTGRYKEAEGIIARQLEMSLVGTREGGGFLPKDDAAARGYFTVTRYNYAKTKRIVLGRKMKLVCVQYPTLPVQPLKDMVQPSDGVLFVDNEKSFRDAVAREGYDAYFIDTFGGTFGHCTYKGNRLLAGNIANVIVDAIPAGSDQRAR